MEVKSLILLFLGSVIENRFQTGIPEGMGWGGVLFFDVSLDFTATSQRGPWRGFTVLVSPVKGEE